MNRFLRLIEGIGHSFVQFCVDVFNELEKEFVTESDTHTPPRLLIVMNPASDAAAIRQQVESKLATENNALIVFPGWSLHGQRIGNVITSIDLDTEFSRPIHQEWFNEQVKPSLTQYSRVINIG